MSFFNSLVNQIGREVGRDVYRSIKNTASKSIAYDKLTGNNLLISEITNFKPSKYNKVTGTNFNLLTKNVMSNVNPRCFLFDDVYFAYIKLTETIFDDTKNSNKQIVAGETFYSNIELNFKRSLKIHIDWINDMILTKETDIALEKANIAIYNNKGFFGKLFHSNKPSKSQAKIDKLKPEVENLKSYITMWDGFNLF